MCFHLTKITERGIASTRPTENVCILCRRKRRAVLALAGLHLPVLITYSINMHVIPDHSEISSFF